MSLPVGHQVIATILKHDSRTTSYKIALLRAINDVVLAFPDMTHSEVISGSGMSGMVSPNSPVPNAAWGDGVSARAKLVDIALPLRMLAERWIAYYWPFVDEHEPIYQGPRAFRDGRLRNDMDFRPWLTELRQQWETFTGVGSSPADGFLLLTEMRSPHRRREYPPVLSAAFDHAVRAITKTLQMPIRYAGPENWTVFERPMRWCELSSLRGAESEIQSVPGTRENDLCLVITGALWAAFRELSLYVEALSIHEWCLFTESVAQAKDVSRTRNVSQMRNVSSTSSAHIIPGDVRVGTSRSNGGVIDPFRGHIYCLLTARPDNRRPLTWERNQVDLLLMEGTRFVCPWTKKVIARPDQYDLDHLLPLAVYPINELWNMLPVDSRFNQHEKRHRVPSWQRLSAAQPLLADGYANYEKSPALARIMRQDAGLRFARFMAVELLPESASSPETFPEELARRTVRFIEEVARARSVARF